MASQGPSIREVFQQRPVVAHGKRRRCAACSLGSSSSPPRNRSSVVAPFSGMRNLSRRAERYPPHGQSRARQPRGKHAGGFTVPRPQLSHLLPPGAAWSTPWPLTMTASSVGRCGQPSPLPCSRSACWSARRSRHGWCHPPERTPSLNSVARRWPRSGPVPAPAVATASVRPQHVLGHEHVPHSDPAIDLRQVAWLSLFGQFAVLYAARR
jgi:hypothetical protein